MTEHSTALDNPTLIPGWVPVAVQNYIFHTKQGCSIRNLAKGSGCHASTVLRQVRRIEARRDDPLVDEALIRLGSNSCSPGFSPGSLKDSANMRRNTSSPEVGPDKKSIEREGRRVLRRLCEPGACLAVAKDMEKAVVVREAKDGSTVRTAVVDRMIAQAMALKDWIECPEPGRISRYVITGAGRAALKKLLADGAPANSGFAEVQSRFTDQHRNVEQGQLPADENRSNRRVKYKFTESPVLALSRRRDPNGEPFLNQKLVGAAERLREDFELAQMGTKTAQNWDRFLSVTSAENGDGSIDGPSAARQRVADALADLGPGLGDVALRVCCFLEGLETAEKRMGWSARSGKIVLRIALQRLRAYYKADKKGAMIG